MDDRYLEILMRLVHIVREGQEAGQIRDGDERSIVHLFSVLVTEFVLLGSASEESSGRGAPATQFPRVYRRRTRSAIE